MAVRANITLKATYLSGQHLPHMGCVLALALATTGCGSMLPKSQSQSPTFQSFDEARLAIENLVPRQSNLQALSDMGLTPVKQPNTLILTHADVVRRMVNGSVMGKEDLDPGIVTCINARDACRGWELNVARISKARTGNFLADFVNFKRRTETTGWRFNALILLVDDIVVYRGWGGQPVINEVEVNTNPLGPLQDMGPSVVTSGH
jgi:hypothetical protein